VKPAILSPYGSKRDLTSLKTVRPMPDVFETRSQGAGSVPGNLRDHGKRGCQMVSFWWVVAAFIGGGWVGVLLMALMHMAGSLPEQSSKTPDLNGMPW
jgi:hypothetical protein